MATYVNDLRLTELATGEGSGTWGVTTNLNLELIGEALGYGTQDCFASDADATTTVADGASDPARAMYFKVTSSASLTATRTLTIAPNTVSRVMLIENATTGSQSIAISQGSGSNVTIASGQTKMVYLDGAGATAAVVDALADLELGTITVADLTATTADINGGTIDGTVIGAATPAAGSFTTGQFSTSLNVDGTVTAEGLITDDDADDLITLGRFSSGYSYSLLRPSTDSTGIEVRTFGGNAIARFLNNGVAELYNNASKKLETTATGIDVTGTAVTDGLTVAGNVSVDGGTIKLDGNYPVGTDNVALGNTALDSVTTGTRLTAIGSNALTAATSANYSVAVGSNALSSATTATFNTAVGDYALQAATGGSNTGIGGAALYSTTSGQYNTALGHSALQSSTTASNNTAVGYQAGYSNTTGQKNTFIGQQAGYGVTTGSYNVFVGSISSATGAGSGYDVTTGSKNTILGNFTGNQGGLDIRTSDNYIVLSDGDGNPRGIFNASGTFLVGQTTNLLADTGHILAEAGVAYHIRDGATALVLNRLTSDGNIAEFYKDGTQVGAIGSVSGLVSYINLDPRSGGTGIGGTNTDSIVPVTGTGTFANGTKDLGLSTARWRDLYLSGGVYLGGTAAANQLDDYEEGTFTPTIEGSTTAGAGTYVYQFGRYTKVGDLVHVQVTIGWSAHTGTGNMRLANLPFTSLAGTQGQSGLTIAYANGVTFTSGDNLALYVGAGSSTSTFVSFNGGGSLNSVSLDTVVTEIIIAGTYKAA